MRRLLSLLLVTLSGLAPSQLLAERVRDASTRRAALHRLSQDSAAPLEAHRKPNAEAPFFLRARVPFSKFTTAGAAEERGRDFFRNYGAIFGVGDQASELVLKSITSDAIGMTHVRYDQVHRGLPVFGRQLVVHTDRLGVTAVNGDFADVRDVQTAPQVAPGAARETAIASVGKREPIAPKQAAALLVHVDGAGRARLAWEVNVATRRPLGFWRVYVDAIGGEILFSYDDLKTARNRMTYTNGNNPLCNDFGAPFCTLPGTIQRTETQAPIGSKPTDDAHDNAGLVYDYYQTTFGRDSYDGAGHTIRSTAHFGRDYNNAFFCDDTCAAAFGSSPDGEQWAYGDGDGVLFAPLSQALDVVAHEMTHGLTDATAGLQYFGQSGALNESYSDIFAAMVDTGDWQIGEDVFTPGTTGDALRSLQDPTLYGDPAHLSNLVYTVYDNGAIHSNSGIANRAAYLTAAEPGYGVGRFATQQIYYRALTQYLTPASDFLVNLNSLIQAAIDLYGPGSIQVAAVMRAQGAVGIANRPTVTFPNGGEILPADVPTTITWNATGNEANSFRVDLQWGLSADRSWDFDTPPLPEGFTTSGHAPWFGDTFEPGLGPRSLGSGIIGDNERSQLTFTATTTAAGTITFMFRVSSEEDFDFFSFSIDGVQRMARSGEHAWQTTSFAIPAGRHVFTWVYEKDGSVSSGIDAAWIDELRIQNMEGLAIDEPVNPQTTPGATTQPWIPTQTLSDHYRIRVSVPGVAPWLGVDWSDSGFSVLTLGSDLAISTVDTPDPVIVGGTLTYTLAIENLGPLAASFLLVTNPLPAGTQFVSVSGGEWNCYFYPAQGSVICTLQQLFPGSGPPITITLTAPSNPGVVTNTATISAYTPDYFPENNQSQTGTTVIPVPSPTAFYTLSPCRIADTRDTDGPFGGPALAAGLQRTFTVAGRCGIPVTAKAVSFNVTITGPTSLGHISLYPGGTALPLVSTMNFSPGQTRANNAIIRLGMGGTLAVTSGQGTGSVHVILDTNGYFE